MTTLKNKFFPEESVKPGTKVKLIRDAIGGIQLSTENNELLQNVFVKQYERITGSVTRLNLEVIFLTSEEKVKNW